MRFRVFGLRIGWVAATSAARKAAYERKFLPLFGKSEKRSKKEQCNEQLEIFTWNALRHFAISCWIEAGLPPKAVPSGAKARPIALFMDADRDQTQFLGAVGEALPGAAAMIVALVLGLLRGTSSECHRLFGVLTENLAHEFKQNFR
jgi:hypothetical protein